MNTYEVLQRPLVTEKLSRGKEEKNAYAFVVASRANKTQIKQAIEQIFKVSVVRVQTITLPGKKRRFGPHISPKHDWKKAVATLKAGDRIEIYEGV